MKQYAIGQKVLYTSHDFDGAIKAMTRIIEIGNDYAIAEEITDTRPTHYYIDDDTDYMFRIA